MKRSQIISDNFSSIIPVMVEHYRSVLESGGRLQYRIYIWSDGEIESIEQVLGDTFYLVPNDMETRELFHICTIAKPEFDAWDYTDHAAPDDESARDSERAEIIDYLVGEYEREGARDALDAIINDAEMLERI